MAGENKTIGRFVLDGILPAPRGVPQVEVTFDIDANGILSVSAKDKATGKEQRITIQASSGLAKEEIDRLVKDAEAHREEDARRREAIESRNRADSLAYQADKLLRENAEKIPADLKSEVEQKTAAVRTALQGTDDDAVRTAHDDLAQTLQRVGQAVYQAQGAASEQPAEGAAGPAGPGPQGGSGTVEGEFREV
jgi:molecular chaperone DnaK